MIAIKDTPFNDDALKYIVTENAQAIFAALEAMVNAEGSSVALSLMRSDGIAVTTEEVDAATLTVMESYEKAVDLVRSIKMRVPCHFRVMAEQKGVHFDTRC